MSNYFQSVQSISTLLIESKEYYLTFYSADKFIVCRLLYLAPTYLLFLGSLTEEITVIANKNHC